MTWISVNPNGEPFTRKSAALALTQTWTPGLVERIENLSPSELADLYNNAEALGLDLFSLGHRKGFKPETP